jgi:hypothetical protein
MVDVERTEEDKAVTACARGAWAPGEAVWSPYDARPRPVPLGPVHYSPVVENPVTLQAYTQAWTAHRVNSATGRYG